MADNPLMITNSDIDGVLKRVYAAFRVNAFPKLTVLLAQLKKASPGGPERMQWGGAGVYFDVVLSRPVGFTASQSGYFPNSAAAIEKQSNVGIKRTYVRRQVDALTLSGTQSKEAAFIPVARKIVQEAMDAAQLGQQEVLHGDGRGIKALIGSVGSTTSITVTDPYGLSGAGQGGLLLDVGMHVAVLDTSAADAVLGRATISAISISGDNATLTLDTAITGMAATDKVVACTDSDTSFNNYPSGLINILNYGASFNDFQGINAGTYPRWDATRLVAGTDTADAGQPSEMDVWELATRVKGKSGKDAKANPGEFLLLTTPGIEKKLAESFLGQRRFDSSNFKTIKGGFQALNVSGMALVADTWNPAGRVELVHTPSIAWVDRQDWVKLQYEDSGVWRWIAGRDAYEVNFGAYWNTATLQRNAHGAITGYTDASRYSHV